MFSKAEAQQMKKEFWTSFAEAYPRKWLLYDTKIKDVSFKFFVDNKKAMVMLDIEPKEEEKRIKYFEKLQSLETILKEEFLPEVELDKDLILDNGKIISRAWVTQTGISLHNRASWAMIFKFFNDKMMAFEDFYMNYCDIIKD